MDAREASVRAGTLVCALSIAWTVLTSSLSVGLGLAHSSVALVAFGATGLLDAAGSVALLLHFRHALRHGELSDRHERIALNIVTVGLAVVALATAAESVHRLLGSGAVGHTSVGMAVAAASALVLSALSIAKRRLGARIPSHALVADGWLSLTGAALAGVTVAGTVLAGSGVSWADPTAALLIAASAMLIAGWVRRQAET
jgi:divalent metal cation (Fe/Co/Zn/Cd) transporter